MLKCFVRFALAQAAVSHGMELMTALFTVGQGMVNTIMGASGLSALTDTTLPDEMVAIIEDVSFLDSIPLWAVTLLGSLFIWVLSLIMILTVYSRFFTAVVKTPQEMAAEYGFTDGQKELLEELLRPEHLELFQALIGSSQDLTLSIEQVQEILDRLPEGLSEERRQVILTAYQLLGKVNYFWGGKSHVLGWDSRWGTPKEVWAAGSPSTGTVRPYGLDCSGFVDGVFYNVSGGTYIIGHGGGAHMQHTYCDPISWDEAIPGDLVFYPEDTHVGIVCGFDSGALISRRLDRVSMAARTRSAPAAASPPPSENARGSGRSRTWRLKAASRRTAACALNSPTSASV